MPDSWVRSTTPPLPVRPLRSATANTRARVHLSAAPHHRRASGYAKSPFDRQYSVRTNRVWNHTITGAVRIENNVSSTALKSTRTGPPNEATSLGRAKRCSKLRIFGPNSRMNVIKRARRLKLPRTSHPFPANGRCQLVTLRTAQTILVGARKHTPISPVSGGSD